MRLRRASRPLSVLFLAAVLTSGFALAGPSALATPIDDDLQEPGASALEPVSPDPAGPEVPTPTDPGPSVPDDPDPTEPDPVEPDPVDPDPVDPETPAEWDVPHGTVNRAGATVLNAGHIDIASRLQGADLETVVKDTSRSQEPVWRDVGKTVLQLLPSTRTSVPDDPAFAFLGEGGSPLWQVSHVEQPGLLWPGWSTESIPTTATTGGVTWSLTDVSGPGEFVLYAPSARLGGIDVLFSTRDGLDDGDRFTIPKNTHAHGAWAFSAEGGYCLSMQRNAQLPGGQTVSDQFVLAMAVGSADVMGVDPTACAESVDTDPVIVPPPPAGGSGGVPAAQEVAATQCVPGATVLSAGHIDYATRVVDGRLQSLVGDDTSGSKVYREPSSVVLHLKSSSRVTLPAGFGAVGAAGSAIWQVPQTQDPDLIWLGWNTESLNAGNARGTVAWSLDSIDGPGSVKVYQTGSFGGVQTMVLNGGGSSYRIPLGVHAHANWAFSAEGTYRLRMTQTVTLASGASSTDTETLTIVVGGDPAAAGGGSGEGCGAVSAILDVSDDGEGDFRAASQAVALMLTSDDGQGTDSAPGGVLGALADDPLVAVLLSVLGGLLVLGSAGSGFLWRREMRLAALSAA